VVRRGLEEDCPVGMGALGITKFEVYHSMCRTGVESANAGAVRKALRLSLRCMLETIPRSPPKNFPLREKDWLESPGDVSRSYLTATIVVS
jgi:hypothetical protein